MIDKSSLKKTAEDVRSYISFPDRLVFFFDEGRFGLQPNLGRCWGLKGKRMNTKVKPGYRNFYLYSSISPFTGDSFSLMLPWVNSEIMSFYLKELSSEFKGKKIMLILDQAGWHRSKLLYKKDNVELVFLPPYSPELNPVEKLWQRLRRQVCRNKSFESEDELMDELTINLNNMGKLDYLNLCKSNYLLHVN